jgi:EpsD family peptidyl-prolyl cis-trans isomerase
MAGIVVLLLTGLSACGGDKEKKPSQSLARVGGEEITVLQLNEELLRANVQAAQQAAARKQLLESLIDRQLLLNEAAKDKLDRDLKVVQAIERAKALIIAQAYMQKQLVAPVKPSAAQVAEYYQGNPSFFSARKQFDMRQVMIATKDITPEAKAAMDGAKSLEEFVAWLEAHKVGFARAQLSRSSSDLPPELAGKLLTMNKGQLFVVREGERSMVLTIVEIKDAPVSLETAAPQIEQFLMNKQTKEAGAAVLKRLRAAAKIEYLNGEAAPAATPAAAPAAPAAAGTASSANERGVAGLK